MNAFRPKESSLLPWSVGLLATLSGALLVLSSLPLVVKLPAACLAIFLSDAVGGRWFGYLSVLLLFVGLFRPDPAWTTILPILVASVLCALLVRHTEPGWLGLVLAIGAFALPAVLFNVLRGQLDASFNLPLGGRYLGTHALSGACTLLLTGMIGILRRRASP